jgi:hypothetical protein
VTFSAIEPSHAIELFHAVHGLDWSVTDLASDARENVLAVVEINKIRQVVHLDPRDGTML